MRKLMQGFLLSSLLSSCLVIFTITLTLELIPRAAFSQAVGASCEGTQSNNCTQLSCAIVTCSSTITVGRCQITAAAGTTACCNTCGNGICEPSSSNTSGGENATSCATDCTAGNNTTFTSTSCTASASSCSTTSDGCCPSVSLCPSDPDCSCALNSCTLEGSGGGNGEASGCGAASPPCASVTDPSILQTVRPLSLMQWFGAFLIPGTIYIFRRFKRNKK